MKILLIDPAYTHYSESPRLAGPIIAGTLLHEKHNVNLSAFIDLESPNPRSISWDEFHKQEAAFISRSVDLANQADLIVATSWTDSSSRLIRILRLIKDMNPDIPIIAGGYHFRTQAEQYSPQILLDSYSCIDVVSFSQQGTFHIGKIVDSFNGKGKLSEIGGISYKDKSGVKVNTLDGKESLSQMINHFGSVDGYQLYKEAGLLPQWLMLSSSQGCPYGCYFCVDSKAKFARREQSSFSSELKQLKTIFPDLSQIRLSDPDFTALAHRKGKDVFVDFCEILGENNIYWSAYGRSDEVNLQLLKLMYDNGCRSLLAGIEVADDQMFKNINKGGKMNAESSYGFVDNCLEMGIIPRVSLLIGARGESRESALRTQNYASEITKKGAYVAIHILEPKIGAKIRVLQLAEQYGYQWCQEDFDIDLPDHLYSTWALNHSKTIFPALEMHATVNIVDKLFLEYQDVAKNLNIDWTQLMTRQEVASIADRTRVEISKLGHPDPGRASNDDIYLTLSQRKDEYNNKSLQ